MKPSETYRRNGYEYQTDEVGRVTFVSGKLKLEKGIRTSHQGEVGRMGLKTDEGGHLIGTRFDGSPEGVNLVPQDKNLNRHKWKAMEDAWATALNNGQTVEVIIAPVYLENGNRPVGFDVIYSIDNEWVTKSYYNEYKGGVPE